MSLKTSIVRVYPELRSAHIERSVDMPGVYLYLKTREDFEPSLIASVDAKFVRTGLLGLFVKLIRIRPIVLEVPEPLWFRYVHVTALAVLTAKALRVLSGPAPVTVTYAIENASPSQLLNGLPRGVRRLSKLLLNPLVGGVVCGTDWICFGTDGARVSLSSFLDGKQADRIQKKSFTSLALPSPCTCIARQGQAEGFVFLGSFSLRKGFDLVIDAWQSVRKEEPTAELTLIGYGPMLPEAEKMARQDPRVKLVVDPPRISIHRLLRASRVLVLPSRPMGRWREQVGLPIVEGLAHGCTIVTTTETGIAEWLSAAGHEVLPQPWNSERLADRMVRAYRQTAHYTLPPVDGRIKADHELIARAQSPQTYGQRCDGESRDEHA